MRRRDVWAGLSVALLAFASSVAGIVNGFAYDDRPVVELNRAMHTLHAWWRVFATSYWPRDWGGDGYRPLTSLAFKLEWVIGGGNPAVFHAANILLYVVASVLVLALARRILPGWAALTSAALFAIHPVHVEAVANVVGQSELLAAVAALSATVLYLRARQLGELRAGTVVAIAAMYAVACLSKEHGVVLPALFVAAELTVIDDPAPIGERVRRLRPCYLLLVMVAVAFLGARSIVLADHGVGGFQPFQPFSTLHLSAPDRILTAMSVVPQWIRLLVWPAHLSSEYGPPDIPIAQGFDPTQVPGMILLAATLALGVALRRRQPAVSFGIAFAAVALLPSSNFLVPAGILLAERTLFLPSVGAMLALGGMMAAAAAFVRARLQQPVSRMIGRAAQAACAAILLVGLVRSATRTAIWRSNDTLFPQAVADAPQSYHAHYILGGWDFENGRKREGEAELRKALALFPYDPFLSYNMAEQYRLAGLCGPALPLYRWTFGLDAQFPLGRRAFAWCLLNEGRYDDARRAALDAMRYDGDKKVLRRLVFVADSAKAAEARIARTPAPSGQADSGKVPQSSQKARHPVPAPHPA